MGLIPTSLSFFGSPTPLRCRISGEDSVPPEITICLRALKVRDCCCLEDLVSIMSAQRMGDAYGWMEWFGGNGPDCYRHAVLNYDFVDFGVALKM